MTDTTVSDPATEPRHVEGGDGPRRRRLLRGRRERRSRWRLVLLVGGAATVAYYALVIFGLQADDTGLVALDQPTDRAPTDRIDLEVEALEVDLTVGSFDLELLPVPEGDYEGDRLGQLREPLQVQVSSPGQPPAVFDFPADQLLDPVTATVTTRARAHGFPFDRAHVEIRLAATSGDQPVPVRMAMTDATEGWNLTGAVRARGDGLKVDLDADRELLPVSFSLMYVGGTVVVALITVAVIGGAIVHRRVGFDQVIWLGAMLVAIPAVRNEMPGVPPIGTAVDLFVFLPSVVIVALALLAAIVVLAVNEATGAAPASDEG